MKSLSVYFLIAVGFLVVVWGGYVLLASDPSRPQASLLDRALVYIGAKAKQTLKETPDKVLEENAELLTRKLYPVAKGVIKGQVGAIIDDAKRDEVPKKMYEAGKEVTEKVITPFAKGLADGASSALKSADETAKTIKRFKEDNREVLESVGADLEKIKKNIEENVPPPPPLPPLPRAFPPPFPLPQGSQPLSR